MAVSVRCPSCKRSFYIPPELLGCEIDCEYCRNDFIPREFWLQSDDFEAAAAVIQRKCERRLENEQHEQTQAAMVRGLVLGIGSSAIVVVFCAALIYCLMR